MNEAERRRLIERTVDDLIGYGPLDAWLRDETVGEVVFNGPREVYLERLGRWVAVPSPVVDDAALDRLAALLCARAGLAWEDDKILEGRLRDGARLTIIRRPLASPGVVVSILRSNLKPMTLQDWVQTGGAAPEMLDFLAHCIQARLNVVVSGPVGAGATSLLGALARNLPRDERTAVVEESAELRLSRPNCVSLACQILDSPNLGVRELLRTALHLRPDRLVLCECNGPETADLVQAMASGRDGVLTTVHAHTPRDAMNRLEGLVLRAEPHLSHRLVRDDLAAAVRIIVQLAWQRGSPRRINSITEVVAQEGDTLIMHDLFQYEPSDARGSTGRFTACGNRPHCMPRLAEAGYAPPVGFFDRRTLEPRRARL